MRKTILFILLLGCVSFTMGAQGTKNLVPRPIKFDAPLYFGGAPELQEKYENLVTDKGNVAWVVFSDRENNKTYSKPDEQSKIEKVISFKEMFYVTDEKLEWLRIAKPENREKALLGELKTKATDYGWIKKSNLLLYTSALSDSNSKIHLKGFMLNKAENIDVTSLKKVKYYYDPNPLVKNAQGDVDLYEFYFVYKIQKYEGSNNDRYLVGKGSRFDYRFKPEDLLGWVDERRISQWNTRIALAPNFSDAGFNERKKNSKYQIKGFKKAMVASQANKEIQSSGILWDQDPVKCDESLLSSDGRRFKGDIIRFPVLENRERLKIFESGTIATYGGVSSQALAVREEVVKDAKEKLENTNVFFLIDGSSNRMKNYVQTITNCIDKSVSKFGENTKVGIGIYKDIKESDPSNVFKYRELSYDLKGVKSMLSTTYFGQTGDTDSYVCLNYAIQQSLKRGNFNEKHNNILVILGDLPDIQSSPMRRRDKEYVVSKAEIRKYVTDLDLNIISLDIDFTDRDMQLVERSYQQGVRGMLNDFTKEIYTEVNAQAKQLTNFEIKPPLLENLSETNEIVSKDFFLMMSLLKPTLGDKLSQVEVTNFIDSRLSDIRSMVEETVERAEKFKEEGLNYNPAAGSFEPAVASLIKKSFRKQADKKLNQKELAELIKGVEGQQFYANVFFPYKNVGQKNSPYSYVLFMPESDLKEYTKTMYKYAILQERTDSEARKILADLLYAYATKLSGEKSNSVLDEMTIADVSALSQGIYRDSGFEWNNKYDVKLKDIFNKKKFTKDMLRQFSNEVSEKYKALSSIQSNADYEYKYNHNGVYYWIDIKNVL